MPGGLTQKLTIIIAAQDQISGSTKKIQDRIGAVAKGVAAAGKKIAMAAIAITAALVGMAKKALEAFERFDVAMRNVWTLLPKVAEQGFRDLGDAVLEMSKTLPMSPEELGASLYDIVSAGVTGAAESMLVLEQSTKAAVAGLTDAKTASKGAIAIMNSFQKSASDIPEIFDLMFSTVRVGVLTFGDISDTVGRMASQFGAAGASMEDMLGSLAFLTRMGLNAHQATTRLARAMQSLIKHSEELKDFGAPVFDAAGKFRGLEAVVGDLRKQLAGLTTEQQLKAIQKLIPEMRAAQAIQVMTNNYGLFQQMLADVTDSHGAMEAAAAKQMDSLTSKIKILGNNFTVFMIKVGGEVAKTLEPMVLELTKSLQENAEEWRKNVSLILTETIQGLKQMTIWIADGLKRLKTWAEILGLIHGFKGTNMGQMVKTLELDKAAEIAAKISTLLTTDMEAGILLFEKWEAALPVNMVTALAGRVQDAREEIEKLNKINTTITQPKAEQGNVPKIDWLPDEDGGATAALGKAEQAALDSFDRMRGDLEAHLMSETAAINAAAVDQMDIVRKALRERVITQDQASDAILLIEKNAAKELAELEQKKSSDFIKLWETTLDRFTAGFGDAVADAILSQESFAESMSAMIGDIKKVLISTIVEVAIKRLVAQALSGNVAAILLIAAGAIASLNSMKAEAARPSTNAEGGFIQRSGMAMVHEGEQIIPAGAQTSRPGQSRGNGQGGSGLTLVLQNPIFLNGKSDADLLAREIKPALDRLGARNG